MAALDLLSQAPTLGGGGGTTLPGSMAGGIPWDQVLANRRQIPPEEIFGAYLQMMQQLAGGGRRDAAGFIQKPTQSAQIAEENAAWQARFPEDRQAQAVKKEQLAFGDRLPTHTQQEMTNRRMTPQERINDRMGGGWGSMDPTQRREILQKRVGQTPDMVNPQTGQAPQPQVMAGGTSIGPSMINGMPAAQAIAQATQAADRAVARTGQRAQAKSSASLRKRNPKMASDIRSQVTRMF